MTPKQVSDFLRDGIECKRLTIGGREVFFNVEETRDCSIWRMGRFKDLAVCFNLSNGEGWATRVDGGDSGYLTLFDWLINGNRAIRSVCVYPEESIFRAFDRLNAEFPDPRVDAPPVRE